jgi:serine/threonine-protein kinase CLA4
MNPGPAPRPPIDRPRLNLTPSTAGLPGNMSQLNIASPITRTATSTYSGSTIALPLARAQSEGGGLSVIKQGWASVKEGKNFIQTWKAKFLILRKDQLDFHKNETGKSSYTIILKDVLGVSRVEASGIIFEIRRTISGASTSPGEDDGGIRTLQIKVKSDDDLYDWIDLIYGRCPGMGGVSNPTNFSHAVHVGFDPQTGEFVGLPAEWSKLLNSSAITKEDYERNPQAVFEVLEFYADITKRADNPNQYPSLTPTPPTSSNQNKQLGYNPSGGNGITPPRPIVNGNTQRNVSYGNGSPNGSTRTQTPPEQQQQIAQMQQMATQFKPTLNREEQRQKEMEQRQREQQAEQERRELEAYNASLPKTRVPLAQQEIGGFSNGGSSDRYNPSRAPPPAPNIVRQQQPPPTGSLRTQRQAPSAPTPANGPRPGMATQQISSTSQLNNGRASPRTDQSQNNSPRSESPRYRNGPSGPSGPSGIPQPSQSRSAANGQPQAQAPSTVQPPMAQVKPLNVAKQSTETPVSNGIEQNDAVKAAEAALTAKAPVERQKDARMSTMTEVEVMAKLKEAVSKDDPSLSYSKQKKIGQGASGSVYVAKVKENPVSPVARQVLREQGSKAQVAIKQMDLAHQPRKELIVNEIMVMKDSKHRNIVNFLDAFLRNNGAELWVVMEYMEGGALTDVIENNPVITEDQISTICLEVRGQESVM